MYKILTFFKGPLRLTLFHTNLGTVQAWSDEKYLDEIDAVSLNVVLHQVSKKIVMCIKQTLTKTKSSTMVVGNHLNPTM